MAYAETTKVPVQRTLGEINLLLKKAGATRIAQVEDDDLIAMQCFLNDRLLRFSVKLPSPEQVKRPAGGRTALADLIARTHRQRARALLLVIKAKLESVESGVESFDEAFLANVVMKDGQTVAQKTIPQIERAYIDGDAPTQLLLASG